VFIDDEIARRFGSDEELEDALRALLQARPTTPFWRARRGEELGRRLRPVGRSCPRGLDFRQVDRVSARGPER
jgi:hypothetical protein